jgi:hypothetical protein
MWAVGYILTENNIFMCSSCFCHSALWVQDFYILPLFILCQIISNEHFSQQTAFLTFTDDLLLMRHSMWLISHLMTQCWYEYSRILALAKWAHISLDSVASLVEYCVDYNLFFNVIKHVYNGKYLFILVKHWAYLWRTQCGPKVIGLIF